jgi:hypothetical protein
MIPDQAQKFKSGIKSSMGRYEANYLSMFEVYTGGGEELHIY